MKAIELQGLRKLGVIDAEPPVINGPGQVLIEVRQVGICGSELHAFNGTHPYRKPPSVLGHEMVGIVTEVSDGVRRVRVGDRVTVDPQWSCGECEWCQRGDHNLCPTKMVLGTAPWPGAMGRYILVPEASVYCVPDHVTDDGATAIEPLGVAVHAMRRARVKAGESAIILGTGPIGFVTAAMCRVRGLDPIIAVDVQQHCLDAAAEVGATHCIRSDRESVVERIMAITNGKGVDVAFLTVHAPETFDIAFETVRRQGRIVLVALFEHDLTFWPYDVIRRDMDIVGTIMSNDEDMQEAVKLVASGQVRAERMITHHLPIDEAQRGFELAQSKDDGAIKVVLQFE